jgi:hypothetical protein
VLLDEGKLTDLADMLAAPPWSNAVMGLSTFSGAITHANPGTDFTSNELTFAGYARQALGGWSTPVLDGSFRAVSTAAPVTFSNSSGSTSASIVSWFFIDSVGGDVLMAGVFTTPFTILAADTYSTVPFIRETGI